MELVYFLVTDRLGLPEAAALKRRLGRREPRGRPDRLTGRLRDLMTCTTSSPTRFSASSTLSPMAPACTCGRTRQGEILYVGKAKRLKSRVRSYFATDFDDSPKNRLLQRLIADVETIVVPSEPQSLILENNLIKEYRPRFNVRLKDDKSYPSIAVTLADPFPRVLVTRRRDIPGARYFGPYTDVGQLRRTLAIIRRLYTVRSCPDDLPRERAGAPCLDYHIGRCLAPCVGWQGQEDYRRMVDGRGGLSRGPHGGRAASRFARPCWPPARARTSSARATCATRCAGSSGWTSRPASRSSAPATRTSIGYARDGDDAVGVLSACGRARVVGREHRFLEGLEEEQDADVLSAFLVRYYVPAEDRGAAGGRCRFRPTDWDAIRELLPEADWAVPQRGTAQRWLELADQNARHLLESLRIESFETEERAEDPVYALGRDLGLNAVPRSLVCVDISHNQGRDTVGSLVWFEAGRPKKSEYRKFKIQGLGQQDDFAAIHEVITRYLTRRRDEGLPLPDLFVIDGGKGQLNAALDAMETARRVGPVPMVSLAKREEEVFLPGRAEQPPALPAEPLAPAAAAGARRGPPVRPGLQPAAAHARGRSPPSCSTFRASAPIGAACCSSDSAVWRACSSASVAELATVPGFSDPTRRARADPSQRAHDDRRSVPRRTGCSSAPNCDATRAAGGAADGVRACGMPWLVRYPDRVPDADRPRRAAPTAWHVAVPLVPPAPARANSRSRSARATRRCFGRRAPVRGWACDDLWVKDEGVNPTGSFKARGLSAAITRAVAAGAERFVLPTAGNAGVAAAAYGAARRVARAGLRARARPRARSCRRSVSYGGELVLLDGHIGDCGKAARAYAAETGRVRSVDAARAVPDRGEEDPGARARAAARVDAAGCDHLPDRRRYRPDRNVEGVRGAARGRMGAGAAAADVHGAEQRAARRSCAPSRPARTQCEPWSEPWTVASGLRVPGPLGGR